MNFVSHFAAQRAVHNLMLLQCAFAGEFAGNHLGLEMMVDEDSLDRAGETLDLLLNGSTGETNLETGFAVLLQPHKLRARFEVGLQANSRHVFGLWSW